MPADQSLSFEPWMSAALAAALRDVGCPADMAVELAGRARLEPLGDPGTPDEWTLLLLGHGVGVGVPVEREEWEQAVWSLAENVAADNAEAHDRAARGEAGWVPLWALPNRPQRRG
ncbi:hypothetical protein [Blastococcus sp. TF02A-30]|uniref:hypothetical protein n=1 Tax=Blastococcus sp. TF02A-30 TaxID=2250580 RepID=UPI000DE9C7D1|nr:hypothetical protein [Blastococcus sp. TF02A-30]RBY87689.1 hypothetical protein DQ241_10410 [Blastococcus sp. TF02A-30]